MALRSRLGKHEKRRAREEPVLGETLIGPSQEQAWAAEHQITGFGFMREDLDERKTSDLQELSKYSS